MKRCPQCRFLYPDSDEHCDFDKTPLEVIDDAEIDAATRPAKSGKRRRVVPVVAAIGLLLGVFVFAIYYAVTHQPQKAAAAPETTSTPVPLASPQPAVAEPSPSPAVSPSPSPSPKASPNSAPSAAHSRASTDPVSTSGPGMGNRQGGKPVILLTSGGKIEADEVWRTKDGVWYRRNGLVTLLKRGQVKSIATR
jgi:hypothetical protein